MKDFTSCKAKSHIIVTLIIFSLTFLPSCKKKPPSNSLRVDLYDDPYHLDPRTAGDCNSQIVLRMLFEGLMHYDKNGESTYAIAEKVNLSSDQKTYTFYLRDTKWSNGEKVTSYSFEHAWKKILTPNFPSGYAYAFYIIKNARAAKENIVPVDQIGIRAIDDETLVVELEHPAPYFLDLLCNPVYSPVLDELDELDPNWMRGTENFTSNGPFLLERWDLRNQIILKKNEHYWNSDAIQLDSVSLYIIPENHTALRMFQTKELDLIGTSNRLPSESIPSLTKEGKLKFANSTKILWICLNLDKPLLNNLKFRKALSYAIDRIGIAKHILQSEDTPSISILPEQLSFRKGSYEPEYDINKAQTLFKEALEEMNLTKEDLPSIALESIRANHVILQAIQEQWRKTFDIVVNIQSLDWNMCFSKMLNHTFETTLCVWESWINDPIYNMDVLREKSTDMNCSGWENSKYTNLLNAADHEIDLEQRNNHLKQAEQIFINEMPIIPIANLKVPYLIHDRVKGIGFTPTGQLDLRYISLIDESGAD